MKKLLLSFYGDDFTGSTDAMEVLSVHGIRTVLFLAPPNQELLKRFDGYQAAGIAGVSRSKSPTWMKKELPRVFRLLKGWNAPILHYKVCSTFDSAPEVGNIGCAIEIGRNAMRTACVPMIVGAPSLRRYVVFGNLYATVNGTTHRIDRHPTMSRHPVTPMSESDLLLHLKRQTKLSSGLIDIIAIRRGEVSKVFERLRDSKAQIALLDTLDTESLREGGKLIWEESRKTPIFVAGSSGVEYAVVEYLESAGLLPAIPKFAEAGQAGRILAVSGSCSPETAKQIRWAEANGFCGIPLNARQLVDDGSTIEERVEQRALRALQDGRSTVLYSALGPQGPMRVNGRAAFGEKLGQRLGRLAASIAQKSEVKRIVIAGGDTSGHAAKALRIAALTVLRPMARGSPLCRAWRSEAKLPDLEILLKGGQVGTEMLFGEVLAGKMNTQRTS